MPEPEVDARRMLLDAKFREMAPHVYFQPPDTTKMQYPCIRYERDTAVSNFANNGTYLYTKRYLVTVIDRNPDSLIPAMVKDLPGCTHDRFYAADNLNHDVFKLFH